LLCCFRAHTKLKKHQVFKRHMSMAKVSNLKNKLCKQVV
jgi:hypothetical protein